MSVMQDLINRLYSLESKASDTNYSDDELWLVLKETLDSLDESNAKRAEIHGLLVPRNDPEQMALTEAFDTVRPTLNKLRPAIMKRVYDHIIAGHRDCCCGPEQIDHHDF